MNYLIFILGNPHRGARAGEDTRRGSHNPEPSPSPSPVTLPCLDDIVCQSRADGNAAFRGVNSGLDTDSCLHFLLDLYSHWLRLGANAVPLALLSATVHSVSNSQSAHLQRACRFSCCPISSPRRVSICGFRRS
jgi:hypothetical protein